MARLGLTGSSLLVIAVGCGASSIGSLLAYFAGVLSFADGVAVLLAPGAVGCVGLLLGPRAAGSRELSQRVAGGLWAGLVATLAYDLGRLPVAWAGVPVFKAISYFGTVLLDEPAPTVASEVAGWAYHVSNGVGFGLVYAALVRRPCWWTAVAWGLFLEGAMLVTPYAEVFGYQVGSQFLAITIGAHVLYGLGLWAGLVVWQQRIEPPAAEGQGVGRPGLALAGAAIAILGIAAVACDFHRRHAERLPPSPPPYIGPHLYTTWNVLEVDRVAALWVLTRFVDPEARIHWIEPFTPIRFGIPFDLPEAEARRSATRSATEVLLDQAGLGGDPVLRRLGAVAHHFELIPWVPPSTADELGIGRELAALSRGCEPASCACLEEILARLDRWYGDTSEAAVPR